MSDSTLFVEGGFNFKEGVEEERVFAFFDAIEKLNYQWVLDGCFQIENVSTDHEDFDALKKLFSDNRDIIEWVEMNLAVAYPVESFNLENIDDENL